MPRRASDYEERLPDIGPEDAEPGGGRLSITVLSVAFPLAPVRSDAVGGAEQILFELDQDLAAGGHTSLVAACEGSQPAGTLFPFPLPQGYVPHEARASISRERLQDAINRALASHRVDLVHMHGLDFHEYEIPADLPVLITLHLPISWYQPGEWNKFGHRAQFCCVSQSQRKSATAELRDCVVIENGIPLPHYQQQNQRDDFALVLGRICPEKNAHEALEAGTRSGLRVLLGGEVFSYPEHQRYFEQRIAPLLRSEHSAIEHQFIGPLSPQRKLELLQQAKCLLHPTLAPETSSLVAMEALAAGTPVIAYRSGALPEIIEDGVTGFLVNSTEEMAAAIGKVHTISTKACREAAERRFSKTRMVQQYFELYEELLRDVPVEKLHA